jgi:protoheme IX farnesyltransferase
MERTAPAPKISRDHDRPSLISTFKELSKSGIVALVLISVLGGYLIGKSAETNLDWIHLGMTLFGVLFLASGSSALNQLQERALDAEMPRTASRPLPSGRLSVGNVAFFVGLMLILGLGLLSRISAAVFWLGVSAIVFYNGLYTLWWKKHWAYAAVPGAVPGALPILMGYAAASGETFGPAGLYLFFMLFFWQMPHFWVLALRFKDDYAAGGIPTLPVAKGQGVTVFQIQLWCLAYVGLALIAPLFLRVHLLYIGVAFLVSFWVLWELKTFSKEQTGRSWLRFFLSVNFSLILYLAAAAIDLWSLNLLTPLIVR